MNSTVLLLSSYNTGEGAKGTQGAKDQILIITSVPAIEDLLQWSMRIMGHRNVIAKSLQAVLSWLDQQYTFPALIHFDLDFRAHRLRSIDLLSQIHERWNAVSCLSSNTTLLPPLLLYTIYQSQYTQFQRYGYHVLTKPYHLYDLRNAVQMILSTESCSP